MYTHRARYPQLSSASAQNARPPPILLRSSQGGGGGKPGGLRSAAAAVAAIMGERRIQLKARQRRQIRQITLLLGACLIFFCLVFVWRTPADDNEYGSSSSSGGGSASVRPARASSASSSPAPFLKPALPKEVLENLSLNEEECDAAFPGLTKEIDDAVSLGPFKVKQTGDLGPLQGRIKDGKVCLSFISCLSIAPPIRKSSLFGRWSLAIEEWNCSHKPSPDGARYTSSTPNAK
jgi:hypothetical protein